MKSSKPMVMPALFAVLAVISVPDRADALVNLGVDGIWVPVAADSVQTDQEQFSAQHEADSFGGSVYGNVGVDEFSIGLKLNYFNEGLIVDGDSIEGDKRRPHQMDLNANAILAVPKTNLRPWVEGGASVNMDGEGTGYNAGGGLKYKFSDVTLFEFHVGAAGHYVNLPEVINDTEADVSSFRLLLMVGGEFGF